MIILLSVVLGLVGFYARKQIHQFYLVILGVVTLISAATIIWYIPLFEQMIVSGYLGLAFYAVVMITGGFKKTSKIGKGLRAVRKEYSIFGFVFLIPHFYVYLLTYINGTLAWEFYGVIAMVIMIPLFVMSFDYFKKKMDIKKWFRIQKFAYLAYLLIFIHLLVSGTGEHTYEYVLIFSVYTMMKLQNYVLENKPMFLFSVKIVYAILFITFTAVWFSNNDFVFFPQTSSVNDVVETYTGDSGPIELSDGDYTGTSYGYHDLPVTVVVTIENGYITAIDIIDDGATAPERGMDFEAAAIEIANNIMSAQSTSVDAIAGATHTTEGIIDAVIDALR